MAPRERHRFRNTSLAALSALALLSGTDRALSQANDRCPRLVSEHAPLFTPVSLRVAQNKAGKAVNITFVGHSTFLIESAGGVKIATDYNDYVRPAVIPDIATMNRAHSTHYTDYPDPSIKLVLRGWGEMGKPARHEVEFGDVFIRNVVTNIRDWDSGTTYGANSIFVFEMAGLCIAHLGHLHHTLTPAHIDALGRIDVVMVPVDGSFTLNTDGMAEIMKQIDAQVAIPMHIFGEGTLQRFLDKMAKFYDVQRHPSPSILMSRELMPKGRTMYVLPGR